MKGGLHYIKWDDGSENLIWIYRDPLYAHEDEYQCIARKGVPSLECGPFNDLHWEMLDELKPIPMVDLALYVGWEVNEKFTELLKTL